jgi:hypothetical protein
MYPTLYRKKMEMKTTTTPVHIKSYLHIVGLTIPLDTIKLQDWPVKNDAARDALGEMEATHRVNAIAAYEVDGNLIPPEQYTSSLSGAVVRVKISLRHWNSGPRSATLMPPTSSPSVSLSHRPRSPRARVHANVRFPQKMTVQVRKRPG